MKNITFQNVYRYGNCGHEEDKLTFEKSGAYDEFLLSFGLLIVFLIFKEYWHFVIEMVFKFMINNI